MIKKIVFAILILLYFTPNLLAQDALAEPAKKHFSVGLVPQYSFMGGLRPDFDYRLNDQNQWLIVSPLVYYQTQ